VCDALADIWRYTLARIKAENTLRRIFRAGANNPHKPTYTLNADPPQTRHKPRRTKKDNGGFLRVTEDTFFVAKTASWSNFSS